MAKISYAALSLQKRIRLAMPLILDHLLLIFGIVNTFECPEIKTQGFYTRYGFMIINCGKLEMVDDYFVEYWKGKIMEYGANVRLKKNDKGDVYTSRKTIYPIEFIKSMNAITNEEKEMLHKLEDFVEFINGITLSADSEYSLSLSFLFSVLGGGVQEFHHDINANDPNVFVLWLPLGNDGTIWIIPGSHQKRERTPNTFRNYKSFEESNKDIQARLDNGLPVKILVKHGEMLKMHAKLLHAGDIYYSDNMRAHFYVQKASRVNTVDYNTFPDILISHPVTVSYMRSWLNRKEVSLKGHLIKKEKKRIKDSKLATAREAKRLKNSAGI